MVSRKIWTSCSIKLKNKSYPCDQTDNMQGKPKSGSIGNINKILKLVPLLLRGGAADSAVAGVCFRVRMDVIVRNNIQLQHRMTHPVPLSRGEPNAQAVYSDQLAYFE